MKIKWITLMVMAFVAMTSCDDNTDTLGNSLSNEVDKFTIITDTFLVSSRSITVDSERDVCSIFAISWRCSLRACYAVAASWT